MSRGEPTNGQLWRQPWLWGVLTLAAIAVVGLVFGLGEPSGSSTMAGMASPPAKRIAPRSPAVVPTAKAPVSPAVSDTCTDGHAVRLIVDNSGSMRGFFADDIVIPGLRSLTSRLLNVVTEPANTGQRRRQELFFVGGAATARGGRVPSGPQCRATADCTAKGTVCCEPAGTDSESVSLQCVPVGACGAVVASSGMAWSDPKAYKATSSRVSRGFQLLFDECVDTAIFVTDGLESPPNVALTECGKNVRPAFRDPGLLPLLQRNVVRAGDEWGLWVIRAVVPFRGKVFLECGYQDAELTQALGDRVQGGHGKSEVSYSTKGTELEPLVIFVASKAGSAAVQEIAAGLAKKRQEYLNECSKARDGGAREEQPVVEVVQVWPPSLQNQCGKATAEAWHEEDGVVRRIQGKLAPYHGLVTLRVDGTGGTKDPELQHVFAFSPPQLQVSVDGRDGAASQAWYAPLKQGGAVRRSGKAAMVAWQVAQTKKECRERTTAMVGAPTQPLPGPANAGAWRTNLLLDTACIGTYSTLALKTQLEQLGAGRDSTSAARRKDWSARLAEPVAIDAKLSCSAGIAPDGFSALDRLAGVRYSTPQSDRGIPGMDKLVDELRAWAKERKPAPAQSNVAKVAVERG